MLIAAGTKFLKDKTTSAVGYAPIKPLSALLTLAIMDALPSHIPELFGSELRRKWAVFVARSKAMLYVRLADAAKREMA